jgi:hypothetical protein
LPPQVFSEIEASYLHEPGDANRRMNDALEIGERLRFSNAPRERRRAGMSDAGFKPGD